MNRFLILKLSDKEKEIPFGNEKKLTDRANGSWKITPQKIGKINKAFLLFRGQILAEFEIKSNIIYDRFNKRVSFNMKNIRNSSYVGKMIKYPTANPASTVSENKFKNIINK